MARQILADKIDAIEKGDDSRQSLKRKEKSRKKASKLKKSRRKYRKSDQDNTALDLELEDEESAQAGVAEDEPTLGSSAQAGDAQAGDAPVDGKRP
jgi:hypothetical protein